MAAEITERPTVEGVGGLRFGDMTCIMGIDG